MPEPRLPFDPIERAAQLWERKIGDATAMRLATSIMRVQQLLLAALDARLKAYDLTFARYEVLVLLSFSRSGALPLSVIGERLMVHPTSVTNAIDRLEARGYVVRRPDDTDRRRTLAALTAEGERVLGPATEALTEVDFAVAGLDRAGQDQAWELLRAMRLAAGDFPSSGGSDPQEPETA